MVAEWHGEPAGVEHTPTAQHTAQAKQTRSPSESITGDFEHHPREAVANDGLPHRLGPLPQVLRTGTKNGGKGKQHIGL